MLSEEVKKKLLELVENQEVDIKDLSSYRRIPRVYALDEEYEYDESEEFTAKAKQLADSIDYYGVVDYLPNLSEELYESELFHEEVVNFLRSL